MTQDNFPDRFIFNEETDLKGNRYKKAYSNKVIPCIICLNGKNILVNGRFNLFKRTGKSKFGDELGIYFKVDNIESEYNTNSKHEIVEFYLPFETGISFLNKSLEYFKEEVF